MHSLKIISTILFLSFFTPLCLLAADVSLSWTEVTTNEDGTKIVDLAGYKVYYGKSSQSYKQNGGTSIDVGNVQSYTIPGIKDGTWYFVVTAYDEAGQESSYSNELTKKIDGKPKPPELSYWIKQDDP